MTIKILVVDQALEFGGSIVSTANLIRGLDREKFQIVLLSSADLGLVRSKLREVADQTTVITARKRIHYNNSHRIFGKLRKPENRLVRALGTAAIYFAKVVANAGYMRQIAKAIKRYDVDIVQMNNGVDDETAIVCTFFRVRQVVYLRGYVPLTRTQRRYLADRIDYFFAVSQYVRSEALNDGLPPEKLVVATPPAIPEKVDKDRLKSLRKRHGLGKDTPAVGIFGRIIGWKGQREFLTTASHVTKRHPAAHFFIVGEVTDGCQRYYEQLLTIIRRSKLGDRVTFTGYVENVYDYYAMMDIIIHSSTEPEPSGRVIFEAMSQGKPVIASTFGGPKEFIEHAIDGFLANPHDHEDVATIISDLIGDKQTARAIGQAAKAKVERLYDKDSYARHVEEYYANSMVFQQKGNVVYET